MKRYEKKIAELNILPSHFYFKYIGLNHHFFELIYIIILLFYRFFAYFSFINVINTFMEYVLYTS